MKKRLALLTGLAALLLAGGCAMLNPSQQGWEMLIDGDKGLDNFNRTGTANWRAQGGAVVADAGGAGYLVTKKSYKDFQIHAEFWAEPTTNSGIFIRAQDPQKIEAVSSYEVNIFDQRPDPKYGTGAIVDFAAVVPMPKAAGRWNTYEVTAKGSHLVVKLNGVQTVNITNDRFKEGPFALQYAGGANNIPGGPIKWRKVMVRPI